MQKKKNKALNFKKNENFSEWFSEIIQKAELADLRYNIKGFLVFQPWSVLVMEKIYKFLESALQKKSHKPYFFPTLISEKNLLKESEHIQGFTPEVFWVTQAGKNKLNEKFALRPTSETAFYPMFSKWIRSYNDLPFKTYQRANVFRYETKATRPFLRSREFFWIEAHCAHSTLKDAEAQVKEDMETTKEILHDIFGLPFIFFERPSWDKFPGADRTFAADVLNPDGKVIQQPSTHLLSQKFSKAFNVKFKDKNGKEKFTYITCYGPAISRIFGSIIITHGDDKGLKFPWEIAPVNIAIIPISKDKKLIKKSKQLKNKIQKTSINNQEISVEIDTTEKTPGEKFNFWEMKGVPIRIDLGLKEISKNKLTVFRRDLDKKQTINEKDLIKYIEKVARESKLNLIEKADNVFKSKIKSAKNISEIKKIIEQGGIAKCNFCSVEKSGIPCAEIIEKQTGAKIRGTRLTKETLINNKKCAICGKKAEKLVYIAKDY